MKAKALTSKGTRDFNSTQIFKRDFIVSSIKDSFNKFGFSPIETPSFENTETLLGKYGDEGDRLIFKILKSFVSSFLILDDEYKFNSLVSLIDNNPVT